MIDTQKPGIDRLIEVGKELAGAETRKLEINGQPILLVPKDMRLENLHDLAPRPSHLNEYVTFYRPEDFADYVGHFGSIESTGIFYRTQGKLEAEAILDYHQHGKPSWCYHRARLEIPPAEEWVSWEGICGDWLNQSSLGTFLDEHAEDIAEDAGSNLFSAAMAFRGKKITNLESAQRLDNGQIEFHYSEEIRQQRQQGKTALPEEFWIGIPVFFGAKPFKIKVKLRYRMPNTGVIFNLKIYRKDMVVTKAAEAIIDELEAKLPQINFWGGFRNTSK